MIPTLNKERLPKGFSYPLGAKTVSEVIGGIPQAENISLCFRWRDEFWVSKWRKRVEERGTVKLVEAHIVLWDNEWRIYIYSVPSDCNMVARQFLLNGPLKKLGDDLRLASGVSERFNHVILWNLSNQKTAS